MVGAQGNSSAPLASESFRASAPKRGDLVSFIKGNYGRVRDVTVIKHASEDILKETLTNININERKAKLNSHFSKNQIFTKSLCLR